MVTTYNKNKYQVCTTCKNTISVPHYTRELILSPSLYHIRLQLSTKNTNILKNTNKKYLIL